MTQKPGSLLRTVLIGLAIIFGIALLVGLAATYFP